MLHNLVVRVLDLYWVIQPIHYVDIVVIFVVTSFHIHGRPLVVQKIQIL